MIHHKKIKTIEIYFLQSLVSSLCLHSLQSSPEVGFVGLVAYPGSLGSLAQFLHQCQVSLLSFLRYSTMFSTSIHVFTIALSYLIFNDDG